MTEGGPGSKMQGQIYIDIEKRPSKNGIQKRGFENLNLKNELGKSISKKELRKRTSKK